jgi:hypothetical protein
MFSFNLASLERYFVLIFGVAHFAIPFILPPNLMGDTSILNFLRIADFVLPGCLAVALLAIVCYFKSKMTVGFSLAFLYGGGILFHLLYLFGLFPSVLLVPNSWISVGGIVLDVLSIFAILDVTKK